MFFSTSTSLVLLFSLAAAGPGVPRPAEPRVAEQIFALDLLVAAAQQAPAGPQVKRRLAENGMYVAPRPGPLTSAEAALFWQAARHISPAIRQRAQTLFYETDVVTTEAHALLLSMLGAAPDFAVQPPIAGLEPRQDKFARRAAELSDLLVSAYGQAGGPSLYKALSAATQRAQPTPSELGSYNERLSQNFSGQASDLPTARVLVAPLMAKDTGATLMLNDQSAVLLLGPSATVAERDTLALHEMLHPRIAALVREHPELASAIEHSDCLRAAYGAKEPHVQVSQVYDGWADYVAESWVRGLSHRLGHTPQERRGFPLAPALAALSGKGISTDALAGRAIALLKAAQVRLCPALPRRR